MQQWLLKRADLTPARIALTDDEGGSWTWSELQDDVLTMVAQLSALGVKPGDRVAFLLRNSARVVMLYHALALLQCVAVPLNTRLAIDELRWQVEDVRASWLLYEEREPMEAPVVAQGLGVQAVALESVASTRPSSEVDPELLAGPLDLDRPATLIYTSGTTGRPKGVVLTFGNHWWSAMGGALNMGLSQEDKWLACVPLFHVSGLSILMRSVIYGMTAVVHRAFQVERVHNAILREGVSLISVVGSMLTDLLDALGDGSYPSTFRGMLAGGGPVPLPLLTCSRERGIPVYQTYGLTETSSQIVTLSPDDMLSKVGSAGKPLFPCELRIEQDGKAVAPGEPGEIIVRGPNVSPGYDNRPDANAVSFQDGWFHTGDIGYCDAEGFLYVLDRRSDLIVSGGENVYPAEVEAVLLAHPSVGEACVAGRPDVRWGQVPVGFVRLRDGRDVSGEELEAFCQERLARYKVPTEFRFVDALPRNAANKLLRNVLAQQLRTEAGSTHG